MLVKHLRKNRVPFGTIVATGVNQVGVAICCKKDQFNKKLGVVIAKARAEADIQHELPSTDMTKYIEEELRIMNSRSQRYFGNFDG